MNKRERAARQLVEYRKCTDTDVLDGEVEQVSGGFMVTVKIWISDYEVDDELAAEEADHADAQRKAEKEDAL